MKHPRASCTTALASVRETEHGAVGRKSIVAGEPYLSGHYPGNPVYPGVFLLDLCEKLASACPSVPRSFDRLDSLRFFAPVLPGDALRIELTVRRDAAGSVCGAHFVGRADAAEGERKFTVRMSYT